MPFLFHASRTSLISFKYSQIETVRQFWNAVFNAVFVQESLSLNWSRKQDGAVIRFKPRCLQPSTKGRFIVLARP